MLQNHEEVFEGIKDLYVGHFYDVPGMALTDSGEALTLRLRGELLFNGMSSGDRFIIQRLRRLALFGPRADAVEEHDPIKVVSLEGSEPVLEEIPEDQDESLVAEKDPIGILSLGGPLPGSEPVLAGQSITDLRLRLHYRSLTKNPLFPEFATMVASLSWGGIPQLEGPALQLEEVKIAAHADPVASDTGFVVSLDLQIEKIACTRVGTGEPPPAPHNPLQSHCSDPAILGTSVPVRHLPIKFINMSQLADITALVADQLNPAPADDGVCQVWRDKAALDLTVWPNDEQNVEDGIFVDGDIDNGTNDQKAIFGEFNDETLSNFLPLRSPDHVDVFIVDLLDVPTPQGGTTTGGGITYWPGTPDAACILERTKMDGTGDPANLRLLAHELIHVLGLEHPDMANHPYPGSWASIAQPGSPSSAANTLYNFEILPESLSNQIIFNTDVDDDFRPDPVDHFIRDFPGDDGVEPSPAAEAYWNRSGLWNRYAANDPGAPLADGSPDHQEPDCLANNHLYVKLEYSGPWNPTTTTHVDLYVGAPGVPGNLTDLGRLTFDPDPPYPKTEFLPWTIPATLPTHSCAFAIAHDTDIFGDGSWPFAGPSISLSDLAGQPRSDNDIVQRNLNLQNCTPSPGGPGWATVLPWLQMRNPFAEPKRAALEIVTPPALDLLDLRLEVDGRELGGNLMDGGAERLLLNGALAPGEHQVLRLRAVLPPDQPPEKQVQIGLGFLLDEELITGYDQRVRIAPLRDTAYQVLGTLFAALRDAAIAFESDPARALAERVRGIGLQLQGSKGYNWSADLQPWGGDLTELVRIFQETQGGHPGTELLVRPLAQLAELTAAEPVSQNRHLEEIRELADRIQEPAGRIARLRLS
jgi:hypothetical protein